MFSFASLPAHHDAEVLSERIALMSRRSLVASISTPVAATLLLSLAYAEQLARMQPVYLWYVFIHLSLLLSLHSSRPVLHQGSFRGDGGAWLRRFVLCKALFGLSWGLMVWFVLPVATPTLMMMAYIILSGVAAMMVLVHALFWRAVLAFLLGIYIPVLLHAIYFPQPLEAYIAIAGALYVCLLVLYCGVVNHQLVQGLQAMQDARHLTEELLDANMRAELSLSALQDEHLRLQVALQTIQRMANQDELTQLPNRRAAMLALQERLEAWQQRAETTCLIMLDIDFFKVINDSYGHDIGDQVLQAMGQRLAPLLRENDLLARFGGEEFVILLPATRLDGAAMLARRLCDALAAQPLLSEPLTLQVTASFGVTQLRTGDTLHDWLRRADQAMYNSKRMGRNQCTALQ